MRIIQTFWTGNTFEKSPLEFRHGWESPEFNWMSWALSSLLLMRQYGRLEVFTDELGKEILKDILGLPFTKVHIAFTNSFKIHPKIFSLAKIYTYSLQDSPFLHVDGDIYVWKKFPERLMNAELIASNPEINLFYNEAILREMEDYFEFIPGHLEGISRHDTIFSSNAGVFGGRNLAFIKRYCREAFGLIRNNQDDLDHVNTGGLNWLVEQISLYYLAAKSKVTIEYLNPEPVSHPLYEDYWRWADVPEVDLIHPVGGCKREPYVLNHLAKRLRMEFPDRYYHILQLCRKEQLSLHYNYYLLPEAGSTPLPIPVNAEPEDRNFSQGYPRTRMYAALLYGNSTISESELEKLLSGPDIPSALSEIHMLEQETGKLYQELLREIRKGNIYDVERVEYEKTADFAFKPEWVEIPVQVRKEVTLVRLGRRWHIPENPSERLVWENRVSSDKGDHLVALCFDLLNVCILERYMEGLDEVILKCLKKGKLIGELLPEVANYFEEDLCPDDKTYQKLVFDTVKRLAFEGVLTLGRG